MADSGMVMDEGKMYEMLMLLLDPCGPPPLVCHRLLAEELRRQPAWEGRLRSGRFAGCGSGGSVGQGRACAETVSGRVPCGRRGLTAGWRCGRASHQDAPSLTVTRKASFPTAGTGGLSIREGESLCAGVMKEEAGGARFGLENL